MNNPMTPRFPIGRELTEGDLMRHFTVDEAFKMAYLPVILTKSAFDYADFVRRICSEKRLQFNKQCREIRQAADDWDRTPSGLNRKKSCKARYMPSSTKPKTPCKPFGTPSRTNWPSNTPKSPTTTCWLISTWLSYCWTMSASSRPSPGWRYTAGRVRPTSRWFPRSASASAAP